MEGKPGVGGCEVMNEGASLFLFLYTTSDGAAEQQKANTIANGNCLLLPTPLFFIPLVCPRSHFEAV
jgi:hypothetical protein